jgi:hypothetical protein
MDPCEVPAPLKLLRNSISPRFKTFRDHSPPTSVESGHERREEKLNKKCVCGGRAEN